MSHFMTIVVLPKEHNGIEDEVTKILAPYDENIEVAPYPKPCWCVGQKARSDVMGQLESIDSIRERFHTDHPELQNRSPFDSEVEAIWKGKYIQPRDEEEKALLDVHPKKDDPDPDCDECKGTGTYQSTYNPKSKWDWWVIGGRWDGAIQDHPRKSKDNGFNFGDEHHQHINNITKVEDLLDAGISSFALVLPDGSWHERGEMGWFACVSGEKADVCWESEFRSILEPFKDHVAVGCDLHI